MPSDRKTVHAEELLEVGLLSAFTPEQLRAIAAFSCVVELSPGQRLFDMHEAVDRFFYLRRGQVKLSRVSPEGAEVVVLIARPRQTFAEALMFLGEGARYPVAAEAIEASELLAFDAAAFRALLAESVDSCFRMMAAMSQRLHRLVQQIDDLTLHNATYRLVSFLLEQLPEGTVHSRDIQLVTPKAVIAAHLAIQPETFSRLLQRLSKAGLLVVQKDHVVLRNVEGLKALLQI